MKNKLYILFICVVLLSGCGAKKTAVSGGGPESAASSQQEPAWHTCLIQGAQAKVSNNHTQLSAAITMQTVRDSMIVVSVMPLFGMEMMRLEVTPTEITGINKMQGQYAKTTFAELNRKLTPTLNWDIFQQVCTGELPTGSDKARLMYQFGDDTIELVIHYSPRRLDVPVRVEALRTDRYTKIDVSKWL